MASLSDIALEDRAVTDQVAPLAPPSRPERRMADAIRALAIDAVHTARSGDPRLPIGMADAATALWSRFHKFDAADPGWPDRDRFVLSAEHGCMLVYVLLHLTGHARMGIDELERFCQLHSPATGRPEYGAHPAIEATTGPPGQGLATAVGMALAERMMAARFGKSLVDHRTWVIVGDSCLMDGTSQEAISLAGHLKLEKLTVLWHDNSISTDASDQLKRFAASGWAAKRVDGRDQAKIAAAISMTLRSKKPTLIACRTTPIKGSGERSSAAPGAAEARRAKQAFGWDHPPFEIPKGIAERWLAAGMRGSVSRRGWLKRLARHPMREEFERVIAGRLPDKLHETVATLRARIAERQPPLTSQQSSLLALDALVAAVPELVGGSADQTDPSPAPATGIGTVSRGNFAGRCVDFGVRQHLMAAAMNGVALHGGFIPYAGTSLVCTDHIRPALRLAALMRQRVIYRLTRDSIGLGEDGPTQQPVEHLASLRAMPGVHVFRPADAVETAECWELALRRNDGPSLLALSCQPLPNLRSPSGVSASENRCARGGYVLAEAEGPRAATLIASGSEVAIAMTARRALAADDMPAAVVSLPCWELFARQDAAYRAEVLGGAPRFGIEAAIGFGWDRWLGPEGTFIGMTDFGASAPAEALYRHFGITPEAVVAAVKRRVAARSATQADELERGKGY
jgi:transketolase